MADQRLYVLELDKEDRDSVPDGQILAELDQIFQRDRFGLWIYVDHGPQKRSFLQRLFGVSDRRLEPVLSIYRAGDIASLTFLDDAWSEYRAIDIDTGARCSPTADERREVAEGELTPVEECLRFERAKNAVVEFLQTRKRPEWLTYRYVP